ncbi:MAG: sterol desaturase family protein [Arenicella sp.]|nr:sterol desaturase family protein [Arenicella sp.]
MEIILLAVPFFFALIAIELVFEKVRGTNYYRINDSVTSLTTGVLNQAAKIVSLIIPFTIYLFFYDHYALFQFSQSWLVWIVAFIAYDFFYYWNHRVGHEINLFWAAHVVHHNSEDYNLSTALRQTGTGFLSAIFYIPMAIIGFEPLMVVTVGALNLVYQFWVHTQHINKMGWFDRVFVSPSNHRVHHAQNAIYIDRNYGGVLILWDRLFGSFQEELDQQPPIYGIRGALNSWNPIWANLQFYHQLLQDSMHTRLWRHKLTIWFRRTGWRPPDVIEKYPLLKTDLEHFNKYDTQLSGREKVYALTQYTIISLIALFLMINLQSISTQMQLASIGYLIISGYGVGLLMNRHTGARVYEAAKLLLLGVAVLLLPAPQWLTVSLLSLTFFSLALLAPQRRIAV